MRFDATQDRHIMDVACDICLEAPAIYVARYHAGLLVCKGCYGDEPRSEEWEEEKEEER